MSKLFYSCLRCGKERRKKHVYCEPCREIARIEKLERERHPPICRRCGGERKKFKHYCGACRVIRDRETVERTHTVSHPIHRQENPEKVRDSKRKYRKENREKIRKQRRKYRARKKREKQQLLDAMEARQ